MATFVSNYAFADVGGLIFSPGPAASTLTDTNDTPPNEFSADEILNSTFDGGGSYFYKGTIEINGEIFIVCEPTSGGSLFFFGSVANPGSFDPGFTYDPADIDPSPINPDTVCFAPGTLIATPEGETVVEDLRIGDLVTTADGRAVPVKWIGRQTVLKFFAGERARPVRVAAGALGDGLPHTDLIVTADHALILDGFAINAGALVNGTTITLEPLAALPERVTYYHVETEDHDVILANGTAAETFVDYVGRQAFDNHADYVALYGDERIITEMPLPRISTARLVPPGLRARLAGRDVA